MLQIRDDALLAQALDLFRREFAGEVAVLAVILPVAAAEQLVLTDKKIIEISLDAGFPSVSYFIEAFRKRYGVSPMKYKKRAFEKGGDAK